MNRDITREPIDGRFTTTSSNFSDTRKCCLINIIQKFNGIIIHKNHQASHYNRLVDTFNLFSYLKVSIVVDVRGLLGEERLLWCSKGDVAFRVTMIAVIKQPLITTTLSRQPEFHLYCAGTCALQLRALLCPLRCQPSLISLKIFVFPYD
ncbi:hypothetical protein J1N35_014116 [Gossypium stocksii]|uniref:Uncharacterized protein n=1 Tax=Gossypium stocksii TaxID=47602 RepID=A0A9D3VTK8_9ROSI|nr:hypothetical protein J1N35_014116 [Gossypium stocksii]